MATQLADALRAESGDWQEITVEDLDSARERQDEVEVGGKEVSLHPDLDDSWGPPEDYEPERMTLWSFPDRGSWATHRGNYRGNWSPYIPRNLMLEYSEPGDVVLDQMCGSGTTLVEAKLLGRHAIGADVNPDAALIAKSRLEFGIPDEHRPEVDAKVQTHVGDARDLSPLEDETVDLVATHPPYANIIKYTHKEVDGDFSDMAFPEFLEGMREAAEEAFRVLKPGKYCGILAGDTRKHRHYVPVSIGILNAFLEAGFILKEDIIKAQWNMQTTREKYRGRNYDFYLIGHEHLYVLRKPEENEKTSKLSWSQGWWR